MTAMWKRACTAGRWAGTLLLVIVIAAALTGGIAAFIAMIAGLTGAE